MQLTHFSANQKPQIIEKEAERVSLKTSLQIHCYITIPKWLNFKSDSQVIPCPQKKKFWFIFIGSEVIVQKRSRMLITLWPIASRHLTRRKKCDSFWLHGAESFQMIYNMNDFATNFFSRYCTLKCVFICSKRWCKDLPKCT